MKTRAIGKFFPRLYISDEAFNKMLEYIDQCTLEIGWLGSAMRNDKDYYLHDVYLFEQEVHSATTEITEEGLSNFAMEIMQNEDGIDIWNSMRAWGHSHVNMAVLPSGQDETQMNLFTQNPNEFFIRMIGNKKGEMKIDVWDFDLGIIYEDLEYTVVYEESKRQTINVIQERISSLKRELERITEIPGDLKKEIKLEIAKKVKEKKYTGYTKYTKGTNVKSNVSYYGYNKWDSQGYLKDYDYVKAEERLKTLSPEEIFIIMDTIDCGGTSCDVLDDDTMTYYESVELDQLVTDYCEDHPNEYIDYLNGNCSEGKI